MASARKIAISLPGELLRRVEKVRRQTGETRSAFIKRVLEDSFAEEEERERVKRYQEGYLEYPETSEEVEAASAISAGALKEEPWE